MKRTIQTMTAGVLLVAGAAALAGFGLNTSGAAVATNSSERSAAPGSYEVDRVHSSILFKIRHSGLAYFYGRFDDFTGTIDIDPDNIENAKLSFTVETASVNTNNRNRDGHIKNADFFNARQYPKANFTSTQIKRLRDGVYELHGNFDFHGVTRPVVATLTDVTFGQQQGKDAMGFHAVFSIQRSEFDIMKYVNPQDPENGPLGDRVEVIVSIEAVND